MRIANRDCGARVARRLPFTGSNLMGGRPDRVSFGRLPYVWRDRFEADQPDYVVWSYTTPIAWHGRNGWTVPPVRYSPTTSRHRYYVTRDLPA